MPRAIRNTRAREMQGKRAGFVTRLLAIAVDVGIVFVLYLTVLFGYAVLRFLVSSQPLKLPNPETITYHYTCHLRGIGVKDEGVKLLQQIGNVDFRPLEKTDQCCGFGGTFAVKYPAISGAIVEDKTNCIAATGARTTVCNDAGCSMNISGMCNRRGVDTKVRHIAELMAEAMGIDIATW